MNNSSLFRIARDSYKRLGFTYGWIYYDTELQEDVNELPNNSKDGKGWLVSARII